MLSEFNSLQSNELQSDYISCTVQDSPGFVCSARIITNSVPFHFESVLNWTVNYLETLTVDKLELLELFLKLSVQFLKCTE